MLSALFSYVIVGATSLPDTLNIKIFLLNSLLSEKAPSLGENKETVARNVVGESALACTLTRIKDIPMLINAQGEVNEITEQKKLLEELVPSANWLAVGWKDVTVTSED